MKPVRWGGPALTGEFDVQELRMEPGALYKGPGAPASKGFGVHPSVENPDFDETRGRVYQVARSGKEGQGPSSNPGLCLLACLPSSSRPSAAQNPPDQIQLLGKGRGE